LLLNLSYNVQMHDVFNFRRVQDTCVVEETMCFVCFINPGTVASIYFEIVICFKRRFICPRYSECHKTF
jgi:hypothetical protein